MDKSVIAQRLELLRSNAIRIAREREKLPKALFWSLLNSEFEVLRHQKDKQREKRKKWLTGGE